MNIIDLGSGRRKVKGAVGVDKVNLPGVDIVHDCEQGLPMFEDNCADEICSNDFIEHIHQDKVIHVMNEIWRVLKHGGKFIFKIPDAEKGQGWAQDPTHRSWWVRNSFKYYENDYYRDIYGIKAKFRIGHLESVYYRDDYWGENWALVGHLIAIKSKDEVSQIRNIDLTVPTIIYTTDDLCPSNLKHFEYWDLVKQKFPNLKLIAFTIARRDEREEEDVSKSEEFKEWFKNHKDWVEIGVHGYDHGRPQEGWRPNQKECIKKALDILRPYLPEKYLYRAPGFRVLPRTENILRELGFAGIAHQVLIKYFDGRIIHNIFNSHCTLNEFDNPIGQIWNQIKLA